MKPNRRQPWAKAGAALLSPWASDLRVKTRPEAIGKCAAPVKVPIPVATWPPPLDHIAAPSRSLAPKPLVERDTGQIPSPAQPRSPLALWDRAGAGGHKGRYVGEIL